MGKTIDRWMARLLAVGLLAVTVGCSASSAATPPPSEKLQMETASSKESAAATEESAVTFSYRQCVAAARRAEAYWDTERTTDKVKTRCAVLERVSTSVLTYEDCIQNGDLKAMLSMEEGGSGTTVLERICAGDGILVQVYFYAEYQPEANYLGMQYGDGLNSIYILVPTDPAVPCETVSGWRSEQSGGYIQRPQAEGEALGLTTYQYNMLVHQCRALAAAGLQDFDSPQDWSKEELYRYLYYRAQDFGIQQAAWKREYPAHYANLFLTVDFTPEDDWTMNARFLPETWTGFSEEESARYDALLGDAAAPGQLDGKGQWQYTLQGKRIEAQLLLPDGTVSRRYTFSVHEGFNAYIPWNGRTYCVGGGSA